MDERAAIFLPNVESFQKIVQMPAYVDHSLLILTVLAQEPCKLFISAPTRFGKSNNMNMLKCFFEIQKDGTINTKVEDRPMYASFKNLEIMKHSNSKSIFHDHFCTHPVIYVNFSVAMLNTYDDALNHCRKVIHKAYLQHKDYLVNHLKKEEEDRQFVENWCGIYKFRDIPEQIVKESLEKLCTYLYTAYSMKKIVILVDEIDAVLCAALISKMEEGQVRKIINFMEDLLGEILKGASIDEQVQFVLLTGISYLAGIGFSRRINVTSYRFPDEGKIVSFYGLSENHLGTLLEKLEKERFLQTFHDHKDLKTIKDTIKFYYDGFYSRNGTCVYPLLSILHYLQTGNSSKVHWVMPPIFSLFSNVLKYPLIAMDLMTLIGNGEICIRHLEKVDIGCLLDLRDVESKPNKRPSRDVVFTLLMELGILTNVENKKASPTEDFINVKIANEEIRRGFQNYITEGIELCVGFDQTLMRECAEACMSLLQDDPLHSGLQKFHEKLSKLFEGFKTMKSFDLTECALQGLMFVVMCCGYYKRIATEIQIKDNSGVAQTSGRVDLWMLDKSFNAIIIEMKFRDLTKKLSVQKKHTSLFALREILGLEPPKVRYIEALSKVKVEKFVLVGLSMDSSCTPSLCILVNSEDVNKVICVSETEPEKFKEEYKNCNRLKIIAKRQLSN